MTHHDTMRASLGCRWAVIGPLLHHHQAAVADSSFLGCVQHCWHNTFLISGHSAQSHSCASASSYFHSMTATADNVAAVCVCGGSHCQAGCDPDVGVS